jgi:hypothetical protein
VAGAVTTEEVSKKDAALQKRLRRTGIFILAAGLLAAGLVFMRTTPEDESGAVGYVVEGGSSYAVMPADSKSYNYEMERLEGKQGVVMAEFTEWFESLWHGRKLAYTLAVLSIGGFLACFLLAHLLQLYPPLPDSPADERKI